MDGSCTWLLSQVAVREADSPQDLAESGVSAMDSSQTRAVYELTALVAHIVGEAEEPDRPRKRRDRGEPEQAEGHIVAHIKARYNCF